MIADFNNHCLPYMSDGVASIDDAALILDSLSSQNINNVFLTPKYLNTGETVRAFIARRNQAYKQLSPHVPRGMKIHLAAQVLFLPDTLDNVYINRLTLKKSPYLLIELPLVKNIPWLESEMHYLMYKAKMIPILSNFERYRDVYDAKTYNRLLSLPYAVYQFNVGELSSPECIKTIKKLNSAGKTVIFGTQVTAPTDDIRYINDSFELMRKSLPINTYREIVLKCIKFYNKL